MPTDKPQATIEEIRKRVPDRITDAEGGHYLLEDIDKIALSKIDAWSDDELEQCLYIMTPLADVADQAQEMKDLLKYLGMDKRVYTLMFGYQTHVMNERNRDRTSLKRINPMRRKWRVPNLGG